MEPREINPTEALLRQQHGALLLDVRTDDERAGGFAAGSRALVLDRIQTAMRSLEANRSREILAICASGRRSLRALDVLKSLGYLNTASVRGGFNRWRDESLPIEYGDLGEDGAQRYARHLVLPEVGLAGQQRLASARVALIGAGGLGAPAALYLVAAGVGHLTLIDDDRVERSNLQRQVIHADARIGMHKTESARIALSALNPRVAITVQTERVVADNVERLLRDHDVIVDGGDNFPVRYLLNAASRRLNLPLVYGAVHRFTGQVSVFDPRRDDSPCYRCLFPEPPSAAEAPNCSEAGVLGVLPGTVGMLQATEALKLVLGIGTPLVGRLLCYDALAASFRELKLPRDPGCPGCGRDVPWRGYEDIAHLCASELQ